MTPLVPPSWKRPEHAVIASLLGRMDEAWLAQHRCWFGGGTAIVMQRGEYRLSVDVDFLCDDGDGYRALRERAVAQGVRGFFGPGVEEVRQFRCDQYGLRCALQHRGQRIKFEIVREARIVLSGTIDPVLRVPTLCLEDQVAEKLLANADRGLDRSTGYRDAVDLGFLALASGGAFPQAAREKAEKAYGEDVAWKLRAVLTLLRQPHETAHARDTLAMSPDALRDALTALDGAARAGWPSVVPDPAAPSAEPPEEEERPPRP